MSNCLLNFSVHSHNQSPVDVCVCPCDGCYSRHCGASLSSSHRSGRLSVRDAYSSLCTCRCGCGRVFSPGRGVCSFSRDGSLCGGCASHGLCPLCFVASPTGHCIAPLDACWLWPGREVGQMVRGNSRGTVTQVQEEHVKRYPEPTVYHGSDPGVVWWRKC